MRNKATPGTGLPANEPASATPALPTGSKAMQGGGGPSSSQHNARMQRSTTASRRHATALLRARSPGRQPTSRPATGQNSAHTSNKGPGHEVRRAPSSPGALDEGTTDTKAWMFPGVSARTERRGNRKGHPPRGASSRGVATAQASRQIPSQPRCSQQRSPPGGPRLGHGATSTTGAPA